MSFRLYVDEDSESDALLRTLESVGIDAASAGSSGMRRASDEQQLAFATEAGRVFHSANRKDFARLNRARLTSGQHHAGIILLHQRRFSIGEQARRLERIQAALTQADFVDRLEWLSSWEGQRVRDA